MLESDFLSTQVLLQIWGPPEVTTSAPNWHGHVPFGRWLILLDRPTKFVELGVFRGDSYLAICEAVRRFETNTQCVGIDTWEGDEHAGELSENVFLQLNAFHDQLFGSFSKLLKSRFEDAVSQFEDASIDLLHIDGLHTYEAVRADYETWLPKMSSRGVMLFHDTQERDLGFGVHQLWAEISAKYPHFEFEHSHGLGILAVGAEQSPAVKWLTSQTSDETQRTRKVFQWLAADGAAHIALKPPNTTPYWVDRSAHRPVDLQNRALEIDVFERNADLERQVAALRSSTSWRITRPLRILMSALRGREKGEGTGTLEA